MTETPKEQTTTERHPLGVTVQRLVMYIFRWWGWVLFPYWSVVMASKKHRCSVEIANDPDGFWHVRIGTLKRHKLHSLRWCIYLAMFEADDHGLFDT